LFLGWCFNRRLFYSYKRNFNNVDFYGLAYRQDGFRDNFDLYGFTYRQDGFWDNFDLYGLNNRDHPGFRNRGLLETRCQRKEIRHFTYDTDTILR
jgi:hypothetical protein